jgi:small-conductance mechanosensitive channel
MYLQGLQMIFLQVLSFLAGCVVLFAAPFFFLPSQGNIAISINYEVIMAMAVIGLCALPYFLLGLAGHRVNRSRALRLSVAALLLVQVTIAGWLMMTVATEFGVLLAIGVALLISVFLFISFVWPGTHHRSHRPMRRRDGSERASSIKSSPSSW